MADMMAAVDEQAIADARELLADVRGRLARLARMTESIGGATVRQSDTPGMTIDTYGVCDWDIGGYAALALVAVMNVLEGATEPGVGGSVEENAGRAQQWSERPESHAPGTDFDWNPRVSHGDRPSFLVTAAHVAEVYAWDVEDEREG